MNNIDSAFQIIIFSIYSYILKLNWIEISKNWNVFFFFFLTLPFKKYTKYSLINIYLNFKIIITSSVSILEGFNK